MKGRHSVLLKRIVTFTITILLTFTSISVFNTLTADASFIGSLVDGWVYVKMVISKNIQLFEMRDCRDAVIFLLIFIMS